MYNGFVAARFGEVSAEGPVMQVAEESKAPVASDHSAPNTQSVILQEERKVPLVSDPNAPK
jgi:hypothetical protein